MPVFTAIAAGVTAAATAIGFGAATAATIGAVGAFAAKTLLTIGVSKLIANRSTSQNAGATAGNAGARIQLPPATNNKLPVIYGKAYIAPTITDAVITTDQTTMYYVCALSEVTDSGSMSFGDIYYNGQLVTFLSGSGPDAATVSSLTNNADPPQVDTKINGNLYIYCFTNGSSSGVNTNGQTAIQILSDSSIPAYSRWTANHLMSDTAFAIVKLVYNQDAGTTNIGTLTFELTNSLDKPGSVILDYFTNSRYGCSIPASQIDTASLTLLNNYSDELITYTPVGGGSATQARYRINGPINTGQNCLTNLQELTDACDSWLQYSELTGKWKVVINQSYTDYTTFNDLFTIDSSNLIGGIDINPIDLNQTYNSLEVQYPNKNIRDQIDFKVFNLIDYVPSVLSPNEANNQLTVGYPQVNNFIQAAYLGERRLLQSREDLVITCSLDYSGIQIEAGDVVKVTLAQYGWTNKLFRVNQVQEVKDESGFLGARINAFEYNDTIYANNPLNDFIPEANTGLTNPKLLSQPGTPLVAVNPLTNGSVASFNVSSTTPTLGTTMYMDFNYGTTTNVLTHRLYRTVQTSDGTPFVLGDNVRIDVADLPPATYYWSTTARTDVSGVRSNSSAAFVWNGPNVTDYNGTINQGGLRFEQLGANTGGRKTLQSGFYEVGNRFTSTVTLPVDTTTFGTLIKTYNFVVPQFITGTTPAGGYIYPYKEGTSTVGTGYIANSTAPYTPADASALGIFNGDSNWQVLIYKPFGVTIAAFYSILQIFNAQLCSDNSTVIQLCPFLTFASDNQFLVADTQQMSTIVMAAGENTWFSLQWSTQAATVIDGAGILWRNLVPGSQVDSVAMTWSSNIVVG